MITQLRREHQARVYTVIEFDEPPAAIFIDRQAFR